MVDHIRRNRQKHIGVVGLWHLGCVLCASWSLLGNDVTGFDYEGSRVEALNRAVPPLYEPELAETLKDGLEKGRLLFSNEIEALQRCDFIFLSYDTPVLDDDSSDTSILERAVSDAARVMKDGAILIVSSQSPVGFCRLLRAALKKKKGSLELAYSPENLRLGEAIQCYLNPERIILGAPDLSTEEKCKELFSQLNVEILSMNLESAEMVKHGINSFLATSIVFANQLADICEGVGARIDDVIAGMRTDARIGPKAYLSPGIGFSGGTLGRDLKVLQQKNAESQGDAGFFGVVHTLNTKRRDSIIKKIEKILGYIEGKNIGILGLTYKPGTSTLRRSLPLEIANLLLEKKARVKIYDPKADYGEMGFQPRFSIASTLEEISRSSDALILLTEWNEFRDYDWKDIPKQMNQAIFFDTKNFLNENKMLSYGFKYYSIGR